MNTPSGSDNAWDAAPKDPMDLYSTKYAKHHDAWKSIPPPHSQASQCISMEAATLALPLTLGVC